MYVAHICPRYSYMLFLINTLHFENLDHSHDVPENVTLKKYTI